MVDCFIKDVHSELGTEGGWMAEEQTSALDLRSAAISCTLSRCSFGADLYMSNKSFISFWDSCAFLTGWKRHTVKISIVVV